MAADRGPYEVVWWRHPRTGQLMARVDAIGVEVYGDSRAELGEQVVWAIRSRGGDPDAGIRWRREAEA